MFFMWNFQVCHECSNQINKSIKFFQKLAKIGKK